jgi:oligo-1,6-glucosidase
MEFLREMRREVLSHYDCITVGETPGVTTMQGVEITHEETGALNMLFQFEHMDLDAVPGHPFQKWALKPLDLRDLKATMSRWQGDLAGRGWNSLYLSNHDQPRPVSRFGDDRRHRVESAKMLGAWLHLQQGTPYIYQGEELGMTNVRFTRLDQYRDVETLNVYRVATEQYGMAPEEVLAAIYTKGRDNARTPMQWDAGPNAGFTTGAPWIEINPNYTEINAAQALADPGSVFHFYRKLIALRKAHPVIVYGAYALLLPDHPQVYAYLRTSAEERLLVICNFSAETPVFELPEEVAVTGHEVLISNYAVEPAGDIRRFTLRPYEARVYRLR